MNTTPEPMAAAAAIDTAASRPATDIVADDKSYYASKLAELQIIGFAGVRKLFQNGIRDSKAYSRYLAEASLAHFLDSGDDTWLNDHLYDLTHHGKNFTRPAAFVKWALAHAPLMFANNRDLRKDHGRVIDVETQKALLAKAMVTPYWEFAPDTELKRFSAKDFLDGLKAVVRKHEGKNLIPNSNVSADLVRRASAVIASLEASIPVEDLIRATPASASVRKPEEPVASETKGAEPMVDKVPAAASAAAA